MYWAKILTAHESKLTNIIHFYFYKCYTEESFVHQWIKCVGDLLNSCELSYVWINEKKNRSVNWFKSLIKENLKNLTSTLISNMFTTVRSILHAQLGMFRDALYHVM